MQSFDSFHIRHTLFYDEARLIRITIPSLRGQHVWTLNPLSAFGKSTTQTSDQETAYPG